MEGGPILLEIVTPERLLVREQVEEVTAPGALGYFGVLPGHTPFLTTLGIGEVSYTVSGRKQYLAVSWGYAEVGPQQVSILAEIAEKAEEIDVPRAEAAKARAEERLRLAGREDIDFERAQVALQKALIRVQVAGKAMRR
jgi:F-type H+-transporting ATPase subunit epsilon